MRFGIGVKQVDKRFNRQSAFRNCRQHEGQRGLQAVIPGGIGRFSSSLSGPGAVR